MLGSCFSEKHKETTQPTRSTSIHKCIEYNKKNSWLVYEFESAVIFAIAFECLLAFIFASLNFRILANPDEIAYYRAVMIGFV